MSTDPARPPPLLLIGSLPGESARAVMAQWGGALGLRLLALRCDNRAAASVSGLPAAHYTDPAHFELVWCIRHMTPVRHDESLYQHRCFSDVGGPVDTIREYAAHHAETTGAEDAEATAGVQRGMASLGFERARLFCTPSRGVSSEHVVKYFHDLVRTAMAAPA